MLRSKFKGICRVDYIIKNNLAYVIEINTWLIKRKYSSKQLKCITYHCPNFKISIENATFNE